MSKTVTPQYRIFYYFLTALFLVSGTNLYAQRAKKIVRLADVSFKEKDYYQASKLYAAVLYDSPLVKASTRMVYPYQPVRGKGKLKPAEIVSATYQLAESYRLLNNISAALSQYKAYLDFRDSRYPLAQLWYGNALLANGEPENAQKAYNNFLIQYKKEDTYSSIARLGIASSQFTIKERKENPRATVTRSSSTSSTDGSNFALEKINDTSFWFTSSRHEIVRKQKTYPVRLYLGNEKTGQVKKIISSADDQLNMGASSLSADGLTVYFTGWKTKNGLVTDGYQIYYMERNTSAAPWGKPILLSAPVNQKGYQSKQPFITPDGQYLFFASDQPGTRGSYDIWLVKMNGKVPEGSALNAGVNINTNGEEVSPYYNPADSTLFFSSDGSVGMGGMDIYKSQGIPALNQWSGTTNLGYPLNSGKNDLYYKKYKGSDTVYFSSDRNSSCCLEIFNAVLLPFIPKVDSVVAIKALPRKDSITVVQPKEKIITVKPQAKVDSAAIIKALIDSVDAITEERVYVNYNFASARIRNVDHYKLDEIIRQLKANQALNILVASFTDCIGSREANVTMSKRRSASVKAYLLKKGIDLSRINTDFFAKRYFLKACKEDASYNKAEQIANRRSDLILTTEKNPQWKPSGKEVDSGGFIDQKIPADKKAMRADVDRSAIASTNNELNTTVKLDEKNAKTKKQKAKDSQKTETDSKDQQLKKFNLVKPRTETATQQKNTKDSIIRQKMNGESYKKVDITDLLEFIPKVKETNRVDEMKMRIPSKPLFVYTTSDSVRIDLYDNGSFDYDSLSVIYNKEIVVYKQLLRTNKPVTFYVKLSSDQSKNEMIFFAESLGITPPNSALMVITDGENKRTEVNISSDFNYNTVVYFIKVNK